MYTLRYRLGFRLRSVWYRPRLLWPAGVRTVFILGISKQRFVDSNFPGNVLYGPEIFTP